ncbi:GIY-YIG nuclease family protein [Saccharicrinis sp. GN24d3]|uniref:GIY-YIG nuclease family protein n=1 Tax=Saccharicrinis sp. GN24d3 TaxID=3458416 RepID=UPI004035A7D9
MWILRGCLPCVIILKMYYTYVLYSLKDKMFYTGYTSDLDKRLIAHNSGEVFSTKNRRPLKLVYFEACLNQQDATHREKYLKTTYGKRYIKNRLKKYLDNE